MRTHSAIRILLYTRQPLLAAGLASALNTGKQFRSAGCCDDLTELLQQLRSGRPDIALIHLTPRLTLADLARLHSAAGQCRIVLWGDAPGGDFAFQAMHLGVRGILPSEASIAGLLASLLSIHGGVLCFEKDFVDKVIAQPRVTLTRREGEIVSLVAHGLRNKVIGARLGITEGTVKVYLYKLFRKLGVNDRLEMALYGIENLCGAAERNAIGDVFSPQSLPLQSREPAQPHRVN